MSVGQVVGVLIAVAIVIVVIAFMRKRRKRRVRPFSERNVRTWSKSDKWQPWR
jgi:hypothetical protein